MPKSDYNFFSRFIHRAALQSKALAEMSFDIENNRVKKMDIPVADNHVFISGLARSGTTILMRHLYETGQFSSLTYNDMPFVLMPNTWKKISRPKPSSQYKERAHQDGIMVGFDSPEAFEEVFWRVFCGKSYNLKDRLRLHHVDEATSVKFKNFIRNVIVSNSGNVKQARYLSKNNNNVLRLNYLQQNMPGSYILVPFRDPLQQAVSLLMQHIHFSNIQKEDSFSLSYMNWLGHFEFGLNQKSFFLDDDETFYEMNTYHKTDINFWLLNWKNYYQYVNNHSAGNTIFINYEKFCKDPSLQLGGLFEKLNVISMPVKINPFELPFRNVAGANKYLLDECNSIYQLLDNKVSL